MDFHSLTRRELQTLCKKNKIPANMTNVAMADALKALEIVEGIEEFMRPSQSETAQSSIESLASSDITSPYVPSTAGRSTRQRNATKEELETVNSTTRTRRTTRKTVAKVADESSQLDAIDKNDLLMTPATLGVTSRRRKVEESAVKKVYSTRRSVRLAEKNVEMLKETKNEESEIFDKDGIGELSGITGVDAVMMMEENCENKDKSEVVSAEKQDISIGEFKLGSTDEEEMCTDIALNVSNEVQHTDGSSDVCTSKIENISEKSREPNTEKDAESQDKAADFVENVILESKDNFTVDEFSPDNTGFCDEIEQEFCGDKDSGDVPEFNETMVKFTELRLQQATKELSPRRILGDVAEGESAFTDHLAIHEQLNKDEPDETEILRLEDSKRAVDMVPSDGGPYGEEAAACALASVKNSPSKKLGGIEGAKDSPLRSASLDRNSKFPEQVPNSGTNNALNHPLGFAGLDSYLIAQPTFFSPSKNSASKAATTMRRMTDFSDNKENIGSGSKLVFMKDRVKARNTVENVNDLTELSVRKLTKMLKEKLEITKNLRKNEHGSVALQRPALQALPENQLVDETQN